ncbi:MAG: hypothetical protein H7Z76_11625 [Methylotenera sp.]|nr:hypothetical protein [Flavobacterium sp.]
MKSIKITHIFTIKIIKNVWIAKTTFFSPAQTEVEMKGDSEDNAYQKLIDFLKIKQEPKMVQESENGNKIYNF